MSKLREGFLRRWRRAWADTHILSQWRLEGLKGLIVLFLTAVAVLIFKVSNGSEFLWVIIGTIGLYLVLLVLQFVWNFMMAQGRIYREEIAELKRQIPKRRRHLDYEEVRVVQQTAIRQGNEFLHELTQIKMQKDLPPLYEVIRAWEESVWQDLHDFHPTWAEKFGTDEFAPIDPVAGLALKIKLGQKLGALATLDQPPRAESPPSWDDVVTTRTLILNRLKAFIRLVQDADAPTLYSLYQDVVRFDGEAYDQLLNLDRGWAMKYAGSALTPSGEVNKLDPLDRNGIIRVLAAKAHRVATMTDAAPEERQTTEDAIRALGLD